MPKCRVTLGRVPTPAALPLPPTLSSAKGTTGCTTPPVRKMPRAIGLAGLCLPPSDTCPLVRQLCMPSTRPCLLSVPRTSHAAKLPDYLVRRRRRRTARRLGTLSLATRLIAPSAKDQPPCLPTTSADPRLAAREGITVAWGGRARSRGGPVAWHIPGRLEVPAAPHSFSQTLEAHLFVRVSLYYVSAYKSTLLWAGGGVSGR